MVFLPFQGLEKGKESVQITVAQLVFTNGLWFLGEVLDIFEDKCVGQEICQLKSIQLKFYGKEKH